MKIRYKIMLWVAGAGLLTSLLFSMVSYVEMREQPFKLLDSDLNSMSQHMAELVSRNPGSWDTVRDQLKTTFGNRYRFKLLDWGGQIVFQSDPYKLGELPENFNKAIRYTLKVGLPLNPVSSIPVSPVTGVFRVRIDQTKIAGQPYFIQLATPMDELEHELNDMLLTLVIGLMGSTALLILLSYLVAGRVLKPIGMINRLSREISDKTLKNRIPLASSRDEIFELSSGLNRMFDRLQYSFMKQKEFLANASHELKSPTAMLRLFFDESLQRQDLPEAFRAQLIGQDRIVRRLERLIKTLLELSVLEIKESLELEDFNLSFLIESIVEDFSPVWADKKIRANVDIPADLRFHGDRDKIRRMLINILDNAVQYNHEEGEIDLDVVETPEMLHISVVNTGQGIPESDLEKVFEQFYRVEKSRSHSFGGSGLGLAIVKEIVRLHGGQVRMESQPGAWAKIVINLPRRRY